MSIFSKNDLPAAEERQIRPDAGIVAAELIRCRWLLLIGLLISAMLSYVFVTETYKEEYSSTATFFVTSKGSVTSTVFTNIETAKSLTEAFQYLLESDAMRRTVLDAIGETEFSGTITTSQLPETNIMSLTVTSDSPGLTFKIIRAGDAKTAVMRRLFRLLRHIFFFSFSVKLIFMLLKQLSQIFPHPKATSSSIISANPRAAPTVPTLLCSSDRDSGMSSSMTT